MDIEYFNHRYIKAIYERIYSRILKKKKQSTTYGNRGINNIQDVNEMISNAIKTKTPYMVARYGSTEMLALCGYLDKVNHLKKQVPNSTIEQLALWSGFFPKEEAMVDAFCAMILNCSSDVDILGMWNQMDGYFAERYAKDASLTQLATLEPWYYNQKPWTEALAGRKVLVIHPFENTIQKQYERRKLIFPNSDILPSFELYTVKAVQTVAGEKDDRFNSWFDALDWMYNEAMKFDFDVAVLGCGAYGFPLASKLKNAGKIAIHLGGCTQLLFGIKGARWDNHPVISKLYNEAWIRPNQNERPKNSEVVEKGCYW